MSRDAAEFLAGRPTDAVLWARRASGWGGTDEVWARRLVRLTAELGDRGGVLAAYGELCQRLAELRAGRRQPESGPSPETEAWGRTSGRQRSGAQAHHSRCHQGQGP